MNHIRPIRPARSTLRPNKEVAIRPPQIESRAVAPIVEEDSVEEERSQEEPAEEVPDEEEVSEEPVIEEQPIDEERIDEEPIIEEPIEEEPIEEEPGEEPVWEEPVEPEWDETTEEDLVEDVAGTAKTSYDQSHNVTILPRRLDVPNYLEVRGVDYSIESFEDGQAYRVACPFHDKGLAAIVQYNTGELNFICEADTCCHSSWRDFRDAIGVPNPSEFDEVEHRFAAWRPPGVGKMGDQPPPFAHLLDSRQLGRLRIRSSYLVSGLIVEGQPTVIAGRTKAMKTSVALDLAISLGSGTEFLGQFATKQRRVAVWSGESGAAAIRDTANRIAEARQINLDDCSILWSFELPLISLEEHLAWLAAVIIENSIDVVILDPLYLSISNPTTANAASNLYAMGSCLGQVTRLIQQTGVTFIILHHFRKSGQPDAHEPASLDELSQAGISEWMRQWILLQRRSKYQCDGHHELWMRCGGSAGHAGLWAVDINEGSVSPNDATPRFWRVCVRTAGQEVAEKVATTEQNKLDRSREKELQDQLRVLELLEVTHDGATKSMLRAGTGLSTVRLERAIHLLLANERIRHALVLRHTRMEAGYILNRQEVSENDPVSESENHEAQPLPIEPSDAPEEEPS